MEKIMKNQIKISLAVLSVLAVSANSEAMFRARLTQPQMPKMAQRSLSYGKAQEILRMPNIQSAPQRALNLARNQQQMPQFEQAPRLSSIPFARLNGGLLGLHSRYKDLSAQKEVVGAELKAIRSEAGIFAAAFGGMGLFATVAAPNPVLMFPFALGAPILAYVAASKDLGISPFLAQERNLEEDLDGLIEDQKRQLRNPEDIQ